MNDDEYGSANENASIEKMPSGIFDGDEQVHLQRVRAGAGRFCIGFSTEIFSKFPRRTCLIISRCPVCMRKLSCTYPGLFEYPHYASHQ